MKKTSIVSILALASCGFEPGQPSPDSSENQAPFGINKPSFIDKNLNGTIPLTKENTLKLIQECLSQTDTKLINICNEPDRFGDNSAYPYDACFPSQNTYTLKTLAIEVSKSKINPPYIVHKADCPIVVIDDFEQYEPRCLELKRQEASRLAIEKYFGRSNPNSQIINTAQYEIFQKNCIQQETLSYPEYRRSL